MTTKSALRFVTFFMAMSCLIPAQGQKSGTAAGNLTKTLEGTFAQGGDEVKTIKLSYARVQATKDPFDKKKDEFRIVLSDLPVTDATMKEVNGVTKLVQTGKLQAVEFFLTADGKPSWGTMLYKMQSASLNEQSFKFERKVFDGKTVAGNLSMDARNIVSGKPKYSCAVAFSAPVLR
jgi:hypothetical protein